jgi:hypothetical protein
MSYFVTHNVTLPILISQLCLLPENRNIHTRNGFTTLKLYIVAAESAQIIKVIERSGSWVKIKLNFKLEAVKNVYNSGNSVPENNGIINIIDRDNRDGNIGAQLIMRETQESKNLFNVHLKTKKDNIEIINGISKVCAVDCHSNRYSNVTAENNVIIDVIDRDNRDGNIGAQLIMRETPNKEFQLSNSGSDTGSSKDHLSRPSSSFPEENKKLFNVLINHLKTKTDNIDFINGISKVCVVDCRSNGYSNVTAYLMSAENKGIIDIIDRDNRDGNIGAQLIMRETLNKEFQLSNSESDTGSSKVHLSRPSSSFPEGNEKLFNVLINHLKCKKDNIDFSNGISKVCVVDLMNKMKAVTMACSYEAKNLNNSSNQRPGDIFVPEFDIYGDPFLDFSVINIIAKSHLAKSAKGQFCGANIRYSDKMKKYPDHGPRFKPLVIESTGGWHSYSMDYLKTMASHIACRSNKPNSFVLSSLLRGCSFSLQKLQGMLVRRCLAL